MSKPKKMEKHMLKLERITHMFIKLDSIYKRIWKVKMILGKKDYNKRKIIKMMKKWKISIKNQ